ncbi:uncharacterized protein LOC115408260 [Salarias fasciatus]|uniref:uncharacterized protein LOC115408260 n=1 Tax=Salarias fasciatus TaxID=181472 RepID=UPI0011769BB6|nr:uncharacterized protein LOC115408260 [Salarias fasciatus]XP_029974769.1 uncharacterized protein LOC115408260 [Salarias fasciatus]
MPRGQRKRKAGGGRAAASKKIITEQAAEAMESETSQATTAATATTAQAGAAADEDSGDQPEDALTQDLPQDDEGLAPGDDHPEEGRAAAGGEDSESQLPHLERDNVQRRPLKKCRRKALLLDDDTQVKLIEWVREHELLWRKGATNYKDTKKKMELWARKASELDIEGGATALRTWWKSARDLYAKIHTKKSGQAATNFTDRELFIRRTCAFLHREVKPRKGQSRRCILLTEEPAASQTSSRQPPAAQPSASTSRQSSHDVEEQEQDPLSLFETQAAVTGSQGTTPPQAPSYTTTRPRRGATRAEPEDSPAMLDIRDCMKATNALMERLVQAQEIGHARQPFITYISQSLQRLPEAQYQLAVERMTAILHEVQRPIPHPLPPAPPHPVSALSSTPTLYQQRQQHDFQPQPQHYGFRQKPVDFQQQSQPQHQPLHLQQLHTHRLSQPSHIPRSSNDGPIFTDMPTFSPSNHMSAVIEQGILQDLQRQEMNAPPTPITTADLRAEMRATTEENRHCF